MTIHVQRKVQGQKRLKILSLHLRLALGTETVLNNTTKHKKFTNTTNSVEGREPDFPVTTSLDAKSSFHNANKEIGVYGPLDGKKKQSTETLTEIIADDRSTGQILEDHCFKDFKGLKKDVGKSRK